MDIVAPHVGLSMLLHSPSALRYLPDLQATLDKQDGHTFRISVLDVSISGKNLFTSSALKSNLYITIRPVTVVTRKNVSFAVAVIII